MTQLGVNFKDIPPDTGFETIPAGWYNFIVDGSEIKPTKNADETGGAYLQCSLKVMDGQYAGRKVFVRFNIRNQNPVAQDIGMKQLSALAHAVGVLQVDDSNQLHGIPFKGKVRVKKDTTGQYEDSNEVNSYKNINEVVDGVPVGGSAPPAPGGVVAPPAVSAPAAGAAPAGWGGAVPGAPAPAAPALAPAAPAPAAPAPAPPAPPPAPTAPPAGPQMTALATTTYDAYRKANWSDEQLIAAGLMVPPTAAAPTAAAVASPAAVAQSAAPPWNQPK